MVRDDILDLTGPAAVGAGSSGVEAGPTAGEAGPSVVALAESPAEAPAVRLGQCRVLAGASSWADRSLVRHGGFYPRKTMTATQRLGYYAGRLPLAEIATTFRFPPTPDLAAQWADRTPDGFVFDVRAWSLLTGSPTLPDSLWPDLVSEVAPTARDRRRLYPGHLSEDGLAECWNRFAHALGPLRLAGRLGVVILRYPSWFTPRPEAWAELAAVPGRLPGIRTAVELRSPKWFEGDRADTTFEWLEDHGIGFVCVDGPPSGERAGPAVVAATTATAIVRFSGRRAVEGEPWTWPYRYDRDELASWLPRMAALAESSRELHLLLDNTSDCDAVDNALTLLDLLR